MELYLIRHADAAPAGTQGIRDDAERPLTDIGHKQARDVGDGLRKRDITMEKLVTSPFLRARQTAEDILQDWPDPKPELIVCDDLVPDGKPRRVGVRAVSQHAHPETLPRHPRDLAADPPEADHA